MLGLQLNMALAGKAYAVANTTGVNGYDVDFVLA
jgi:hypothetical protein